MRVERLPRSRCAETRHADEGPARPEPTLPAELDCRLDGNPRGRAEYRLLIFFWLLLEEFPAGHRDHRGANAVPPDRVARRSPHRNLAPGPAPGPLARPARP